MSKFPCTLFTGVSTGRTMKLRVSVQGVLLTALVDSDSTHNFLADGVAEHIGVRLDPLPGMKVMVANGDRVASLGCTAVCASTSTMSFSTSTAMLYHWKASGAVPAIERGWATARGSRCQRNPSLPNAGGRLRPSRFLA